MWINARLGGLHGARAGRGDPSGGERLPGAGGDQLLARLATPGPCPVTLVEDTSADREWAPLHSHPWDELTYVLEGELEFTVDPDTRGGGPGTLVSLPLERLVEVAGRHGVRPAFDLPDA